MASNWPERLSNYTLRTAKCSSIKSLRVHDICHVYSLASLQWSGPSDQWMLLPTQSCLQCQKMSPQRGRRALSTPVCVKKEKWPSQCRPRVFCSQPRQLPCAWHRAETRQPLPFSLAQNLVFKTDCAYWLLTCGQSCMTSTLIISG